MRGVDHFPGAGRPVELCAGCAPFLRAVGDEQDVVLWLIAGIDHALSHGQDEPDSAAVILKAVEIHIVMTGDDDLLLIAASLQPADHIVAGALLLLHLIVHDERGHVIACLDRFRKLAVLTGTDADAGHHILGADILHVDHLIRVCGVPARCYK